MVSIVGESNQPAIRSCRTGEPVSMFHEPDDLHDRRALVVSSAARAKTGYIARDHWLHGAIHDGGKGCFATIADIEAREGGLLGVVLAAATSAGLIEKRSYAAADLSTVAAPPQRGLLMDLLGRWFGF